MPLLDEIEGAHQVVCLVLVGIMRGVLIAWRRLIRGRPAEFGEPHILANAGLCQDVVQLGIAGEEEARMIVKAARLVPGNVLRRICGWVVVTAGWTPRTSK